MADNDRPGKQYEFDIAKNRLQLLGGLVAERTNAYYTFRQEQDTDSASHWLNVIASLLLELEQDGRENDYNVDELWDEVNTLERRLNNGNFRYRQFRKKLEKVNREIEKIRKESGLDIPSKTLKEEGMEMLR